MPLYLIIFLMINIMLTYNTRAATNTRCPETLTTQQLIQLDQHEQINYNDKTYILDGSSRKIIHNAHLKLEGKEPYEQTVNGKTACWYPTDRGHIGIRQK